MAFWRKNPETPESPGVVYVREESCGCSRFWNSLSGTMTSFPCNGHGGDVRREVWDLERDPMEELESYFLAYEAKKR